MCWDNNFIKIAILTQQHRSACNNSKKRNLDKTKQDFRRDAEITVPDYMTNCQWHHHPILGMVLLLPTTTGKE